MDIRLLEQTDSYHRLQEVEHVVLLPVHLFLRKCPTEKKQGKEMVTKVCLFQH